MRTSIILAVLSLIIVKSEVGASQAQSTIVSNNIILSGKSLTSVANGSTIPTPSANQIATTKAVDTAIKSSVPAIARESISLTTTGVGGASYNNTTGILNIPVPVNTKRIESYSGTSNSSGVYTIIFDSAFSVAPNVQASISNQSSVNQFIKVTSVSTTECTINVYTRAVLSVLGLDVLAGTVTNLNGATIDVIVMEK